MIPAPPVIRILEAARSAISPARLAADSGIAGPWLVRHARNRKVHGSDKPAMTLVFVSDEPRPDDNQLNDWEKVRELVFDLQCDLDLATEDSNADPTGMLWLMRSLAAAIQQLKDANEPIFLGGLVDFISAGAIDPDERSTPDVGRMTWELIVVYRVRSDDPNALLSSGENA